MITQVDEGYAAACDFCSAVTAYDLDRLKFVRQDMRADGWAKRDHSDMCPDCVDAGRMVHTHD